MQRLLQRFPWLVQVPRATIDQLARRPWLSMTIVLAMVFFSAGTSLVTMQGRRGPHPPPHRHHRPPAVIVSLEKTSLGLETRDGWAKTVLVDERTTFWMGREPARWEDLQVGQRVHVRDERLPGGRYVAREIHLAPPGPPPPPPGARMADVAVGLALVAVMAFLWKRHRQRCLPPTPPPSTGGDPEHTSS